MFCLLEKTRLDLLKPKYFYIFLCAFFRRNCLNRLNPLFVVSFSMFSTSFDGLFVFMFDVRAWDGWGANQAICLNNLMNDLIDHIWLRNDDSVLMDLLMNIILINDIEQSFYDMMEKWWRESLKKILARDSKWLQLIFWIRLNITIPDFHVTFLRENVQACAKLMAWYPSRREFHWVFGPVSMEYYSWIDMDNWWKFPAFMKVSQPGETSIQLFMAFPDP